MKQYIFSAVCLMSGVLCMSSCNEDKQAKPYTPDYEIVPEYTNADTWTAYEAFNDNLLDPDKNIYKTSTAYYSSFPDSDQPHDRQERCCKGSMQLPQSGN